MGGSSETTIGYKYFIGSHMIACLSKIDAVLALKWRDKIGWEAAAIDKTIRVDKKKLFGGEKKEGGVSGYIDILGGGNSQGRNDYLSDQLGADNISAFRGVVSLVFRHFYWTNNPFVPPVSIKVKRIKSTFGSWYPEKAEINGEIKLENTRIYIAMDRSTSMIIGSRLQTQYSAIKKFLEALKGQRGNSVKIVTYASTVISSVSREDCDDSDYDALIAWVDALGNGGYGGTDFSEAVSQAYEWFVGAPQIALEDSIVFPFSPLGYVKQQGEASSGDNNKNGDRRILLFLTDGEPSPVSSVDGAVATIDAIDDLEVFGFNIDLENTYYTDLLDNTSEDGVPVVSGSGDELILAIQETFTSFADINPAHILRDLICNPILGGSGDESEIGESFAAAADQLYDEGFGLSLFHASPSDGETFKRLVETHIDGVCYQDTSTGKWEISLIRDDYDVEDLPVIDRSQIIEWMSLERPEQSELPNQITLEYTNRDDGETSSLVITNVAAVQEVGRVIPDKVNYEGITFPNLASSVASRDLVALTVPLWSGQMRVSHLPAGVQMGKPFVLTDTKMGLSGIIARAGEIEEGDGRDNSASFLARKDHEST